MPTRQRCCAVPGCPALVVVGKCAKHRREEQQRYAQHRPDDSFYKSWEWRRLRARKLELNPGCEVCAAQGQLVKAVEAHHRVARRAGGPDTLENLISLCRACHNRAHPRGAVRGLPDGGLRAARNASARSVTMTGKRPDGR